MTAVSDRSVSDFVDREAELLDARRFGDWLDLLTDDAFYWVPLSPDQTDPLTGPSHIFESKDALMARVLRLEDPQTVPQQPYSRCSRIVGRVRLDGDAVGKGVSAVARAPFHLVEAVARHDAEETVRMFAGAATWGLSDETGELRIRWKRIDLVNSERGLFGASILL